MLARRNSSIMADIGSILKNLMRDITHAKENANQN